MRYRFGDVSYIGDELEEGSRGYGNSVTLLPESWRRVSFFFYRCNINFLLTINFFLAMVGYCLMSDKYSKWDENLMKINN